MPIILGPPYWGAKYPTRVVTDAEGRATTPDAAKLKGVVAEVVFMRDDGWTLGAPLHLQRVAYEMWRGSWKQVRHLATDRVFRLGRAA